MSHYTRINTPLGKNEYGEDILLFRQLKGDDAINRLFHYELQVQSLSNDIDPSQLVGKMLGVKLDDQYRNDQFLHTMIQSFAWTGSEEKHQIYTMTLVPWLALADLRADCRIFQNKSVSQIIHEVLLFYPYPVQDRLKGKYPAREYCVQYNETDLAFICRLMEHEGISFHWHHKEKMHTLVLDDFLQEPETIKRHEKIEFRRSDNNAIGDAETLFEWHAKDSMVSGRYATDDYWFKQPTLPRLKEHRVSRGQDVDNLEIYHWPGNYQVGPDGERLTHIRSQQQQMPAQTMQAQSNVRGFAFGAAGAAFTLERHPYQVMNQQYLILGTHLYLAENPNNSGKGSVTEWQISLHMMPAKVAMRPAMLTPRPRILSIQQAKVVGKAGAEVWTNEYGQVKLHFGWDRYSKQDENSSCWVRVSSSWAGSNWGELMIPRIGQEVLVAYTDGDPDCPVIIGRVNNSQQMPTSFSHTGTVPYNQALSGVKTKEFEGNRYNQLLFDDTKGEIRTQIESKHGVTQVNLGFLTEPRNNARAAPRGEGFEMRTDDWGVMRAAKGILITTTSQGAGAGNAMARQDMSIGMDEALEQAKAQGDYAKAHQGLASDQAAQKKLAQAVKEWGHGSNVEKGDGGGAPIVALNAPAGIAMFTPLSSTYAAAQHLDWVAGKNQQLSAGATMHLHAGMGLSLFAQSGGVRSIAHEGKHIIQAQQDDIQIQADQSVQITASHNHVLVAADKHITLMCGGAYIKLAGGNIELHAPGTIDMKAANYTMQGPTSGQATLPKFEKGEVGRKFKLHFANAAQAVVNRAFKVALKDGRVVEGKTDEDGETDLLKDDLPHIAKIEIKPHHE